MFILHFSDLHIEISTITLLAFGISEAIVIGVLRGKHVDFSGFVSKTAGRVRLSIFGSKES